MNEQKSKTWAETVEEIKQSVKVACSTSSTLHEFYTHLKSRTADYIEMHGATDPKFSTDSSFMETKMLIAWLVSAESCDLIELQLEWRISFCATCSESNPGTPFHVALVKA